MNFETNTPTQEKEEQQKHFESVAQELLENKDLKELPPAHRGTVIIDRFIGSIVRHGNVKGSKTSYSPADVLKGMDRVSQLGHDGLREITSTDGLRVAVRSLALDPDTAELFGQISGRLNKDTEGTYTLTSVAQIEGYLVSGGEKNVIKDPVGGVDMQGEDWIPVLTEQVQNMAENPDVTWMTEREARDLTTSSGPLLKNTGRDWLMATSSARKAGVNVELIGRSAERVQRRIKDGHDLAGAALFLATKGQIDEYKKDLDRRSGY